jgi:hypothetical protein
MITLSTIFVLLRYYARYLSSTSFNMQDVLIPLGWLAEVGLCVTGISMSTGPRDGLLLTYTVMVNMADTGRHMAYIVSVDPNRVTEHFKGTMVLEFLHPAAVAFPKLLVVLIYLHILTNKHERMVAKGLVIFIGATWISYTAAAMFQCTPFAFNWDKTVAGGKCFSIQAFANSSSVPNILSDIAVLILPLRTVWGLKISLGRRIGLLCIFLTGSIGLIASIVRTAVFAETLARAGKCIQMSEMYVRRTLTSSSISRTP